MTECAFGAVYYVPIEYKSKDKVKETIHQQLLQLERQVKKRSQKQARLADEAAPTTAPAPVAYGPDKAAEQVAGPQPLEKDLEALLEDEMDMLDLSDEEDKNEPAEKQSGRKRKMAQGTDKEARAAARTAAKAQAAAERQEKKEAAVALRTASAALPKLSSAHARLEETLRRAPKLHPTPAQQADLDEAECTCRTLCAGGRRKSNLEFDSAALKEKLKTWTALLAGIRKTAPKASARQTAKGGA